VVSIGSLFVVSGPSGVGKDTVLQRVLARLGQGALMRVTTATTRPMRPGDTDGVSYHFLSRDEFERRVAAGWFLEWASYGGELYGTPAGAVAETRAAGRHVLIQIDVQGADQVRALASDAVLIFIAPPTMAAMRERLLAPGADARNDLAQRLRRGAEEVAGAGRFDFVVINDVLEEAADELESLLIVHGAAPIGPTPDQVELAERCAVSRRRSHLDFLLEGI
jgi:guanylate kinase